MNNWRPREKCHVAFWFNKKNAQKDFGYNLDFVHDSTRRSVSRQDFPYPVCGIWRVWFNGSSGEHWFFKNMCLFLS